MVESDDPLANEPELQKALGALYEVCCGEDRYARLIEVRDVKQARLYWRGLQYNWWSEQDQQFYVGLQGQPFNPADLNVDDMPRFEFVTNIFQSRGLGVIAAVTGAPLKVKFFPQRGNSPDDIETAEAYEKLAELIQRWNPPKMLMQEEGYLAWTDGVVGLLTENISDAEKFGSESQEMLDAGETTSPDEVRCSCGFTAPADHFVPPTPCPDCGQELTEENVVPGETTATPVSAGTNETPNNRQTITVWGALNLKRPQWAQHQEDFHYLALEKEVHYALLRNKFPDKTDEIKPGANFGSNDAFERNARLSVAEGTKLLTQTGGAQQVLVTHARVWFRKSAFNAVKDKAMGKRLAEVFPKGCYVQFAGPTYLKSEAQSMDSVWKVYHALPGDGQHRAAMGTSMIEIQDRVNVYSNIEAETYEYGIPITYRDRKTFDETANEDQRAEPGAEVPVIIGPGEDIRQKIYQVRADSVSPDMYKHNMDLIGPVSDKISGNYPALSGAGADAGAPDTLGQQAMQRDQAMGRMGIPYSQIKQAHADILTLACRDFRKHASGPMTYAVMGDSGEFEDETVDLTALNGEAEAYPEGDEAFPDTILQQRNTVIQVVDSPVGAGLMSEPDNADLMVRLLGVSDLVVPGAAAKQKALRDIGILTKTPIYPNPLVEIDPLVEDAKTALAEATTIKNYLLTSEGQKLKRENPQAYMAIRMHLQALAQVPQPQPQAPPPKESFTANFKDLPPAAQIQALAEMGIHITPEDIILKTLVDKASKPTPKPPIAPGSAPPAKGAPNA
jgi:hypothetical protein